MVQTSPSNAKGAGLIPGQGAKIPHALGPKNQNMKQKQISCIKCLESHPKLPVFHIFGPRVE